MLYMQYCINALKMRWKETWKCTARISENQGWIDLLNFVMRFMIQRRNVLNENVPDMSCCLVTVLPKKLLGPVGWVVLTSQVKCTRAVPLVMGAQEGEGGNCQCGGQKELRSWSLEQEIFISSCKFLIFWYFH